MRISDWSSDVCSSDLDGSPGSVARDLDHRGRARLAEQFGLAFLAVGGIEIGLGAGQRPQHAAAAILPARREIDLRLIGLARRQPTDERFDGRLPWHVAPGHSAEIDHLTDQTEQEHY